MLHWQNHEHLFSKSIPIVQFWCQNLGIFLRVKFGLKVLLRVKRLTFCNSGCYTHLWCSFIIKCFLTFPKILNCKNFFATLFVPNVFCHFSALIFRNRKRCLSKSKTTLNRIVSPVLNDQRYELNMISLFAHFQYFSVFPCSIFLFKVESFLCCRE